MTYQYLRLAIYRLPKYRDVDYIELHKEDGTPLPYIGEEEAFYLFGTKKIKDTWTENKVLHCSLEGVM